MWSRSLIGIDIGCSSIKVVELSGGSAKKLKKLGLEVIPPGVIEDGYIKKMETLSLIFKKLIKRLHISTLGRKAALSLGGNGVIIRRVNLDGALEGPALAEQLRFEAEQYFQQEIENLYYDHVILEEQSSSPQEGLPILLAGARREFVEQQVELVHTAGLKVGVVEFDVFSISNMFEYNYGHPDGLIALVNVGASSTQVSFLFNGHYLYTRDVPIAGRDYTQALADGLSMDLVSAESMKVGVSQPDGAIMAPDALRSLVSHLNDQLVHEVQTTFDFFFQSDECPSFLRQRDVSARHLFLSGGGARTLGLDVALAAGLKVQVSLLNPFHRILVPPKRFNYDYIRDHGHLYGVAVGLALRGFKDGERGGGGL